MTLRNRAAAIIATILFIVLAGTTTAAALWSTTASVGGSVKIATLSAACGSTAMLNASFEDPVLPGNLGYANDGEMTGWRAKDAVGTPVRIEIWRGYDGVPAGTGSQHVELNADVPGTLFQTLDTVPGQTLQWSLMHRGRSGVDTMQLLIGAENATGVSQGDFSDDNTAWRRYSGAYVVPAGQTRTTLAFKAVSAAGGASIGNFLDDVSFGSGPCLVATNSVANITNPGGLYRAGDTVEYTTVVNNTGSSLSQSTVYEAVVPAGVTYTAGSITIDGVARTDALADDQANYIAGTTKVVARIGSGATTTAGGTIAQNTQLVTVRFRATIPPSSAGSTISLTPSVAYANGLASGWGLTAASNTASFTVTLGANLGVTIAAVPTNVEKSASNTTVTWTVTVTNNGPLASGANGTVTITIPNTGAGTTPVPTTTGGASCAAISGGQSVCTITAAMASGASRTFTVVRTTLASHAVGTTYTLSATAASSVSDPVAANNTASSVVTVVDTTAPTVPGRPTATAPTATSIALTWAASTDLVGVTAYDIYRNGVLVGSSATTSYTNTGVTSWTVYSYTIVARDAAGNASAASPARLAVAVPASSYRISRDPGTGMLCIAASGTTNGSTIQVGAACTAATTRDWTFVADVDGFVRIRMTTVTRYWTVPVAAVSGSSVTSTNSSTSATQRWTVIPRGGTLYSFQSASHPTLCMQRITLTTIEMRTCSAVNADQQFDLTVRP